MCTVHKHEEDECSYSIAEGFLAEKSGHVGIAPKRSHVFGGHYDVQLGYLCKYCQVNSFEGLLLIRRSNRGEVRMQIQKSQIYMYDWRDENTEEIRMLSHEQQLAIANSRPRVESFLRQEDKRRANPFPLVLEVLGEA